MIGEHSVSISIDDSESNETIQQDGGTEPAVPLVNEYNPSLAETSTHQNQGIKLVKDKGKEPADPLANEFNPSSKAESSTPQNHISQLADEAEEEAEEGRHWQFANSIPRPEDVSIDHLSRRLAERRRGSRGISSSSASIYEFPTKLEFGSIFIQEPEIVSIGPYHRGRNHLLMFEDHKLTFLEEFLSKSDESLGYHMNKMKEMESFARRCYQKESGMSSQDFVEMMLLDGCFIIVLLHLLAGEKAGQVDTKDYEFIFAVPWRIPVLSQDLLKMENQLPYDVLRYLSPFYSYPQKFQSLPSFALNVFSLSFPMPLDKKRDVDRTPLHLLELVYQNLLPTDHNFRELDYKNYHPSNQSIQSVTRLRLSGIKCRPIRETTSFLDIKYEKEVLEIPTITMNDYTWCILINCMAWEQSHQYESRTFSYFTDYIAFMNLLISEPKDVTFLCADGIISKFSEADGVVASWLARLKSQTIINNRSSYLSKELRKLEANYSSNRATVLRTYFNSPWSIISVFTASLLVLCSLIQSIMSIVSYKAQPR